MPKDEITRRLEQLEEDVRQLKNSIHQQEITDNNLLAEVKSLNKEFENLKETLIESLERSNKESWKITMTFLRCIIGLLLFIAAIVGIKVSPEIFGL